MNKTNKIIIIILSILLLASIVIFGILNVNNKNNNNNSNNGEDVKTPEEVMNETYIPFKLNEANNVIDDDDIKVENVHVPKLNLNNSGAKSFNEKLMVELYQQEKLKLDYYDLNWSKKDYSTKEYKSGKDFEKPKNLEKMIEIAEKLSKEFKFVRVDLYNINGSDGNTYTLNYKAYTKGNILLISAVGTYSFWPLNGDGNFYYDYAYNLKENKEISVIDALKALKINEKQIVNFTDKCYEPGDNSVEETKCTIDLVKSGFQLYKWYHIDYKDDMINGIKYNGVVNY